MVRDATTRAGPSGARRRTRPTKAPDGEGRPASRPLYPGPIGCGRPDRDRSAASSPVRSSRRARSAHADSGCTNEWAPVAKAARHDPRTPGELEPTQLVHLRLCGPEEGLAETQRH